GLGKSLDPGIQFAPARSDLAFLVDLPGCVLYAIADRPLVNIKSDVVHSVSRSLLGLFSESASQLSSAFVTPLCSSSTYHPNNSLGTSNGLPICLRRDAHGDNFHERPRLWRRTAWIEQYAFHLSAKVADF